MTGEGRGEQQAAASALDEETKQELGAAAGKEAAAAVATAAVITTTAATMPPPPPRSPRPPAVVVVEAGGMGMGMGMDASFRLPLPPGATSLPVDPHDDPLLLGGAGDGVEVGGSSNAAIAVGGAAGAAGAGVGDAGGSSGPSSPSYVPLADLRFPYYPETLLSTQAMASTSSLEGASVHSLSLEPAPSLTSLADTSSVGDMSDMASLSLRDHALLYGRDGAPLYNVSRWGVGG